jgi:hypothetical protein
VGDGGGHFQWIGQQVVAHHGLRDQPRLVATNSTPGG